MGRGSSVELMGLANGLDRVGDEETRIKEEPLSPWVSVALFTRLCPS